MTLDIVHVWDGGKKPSLRLGTLEEGTAEITVYVPRALFMSDLHAAYRSSCVVRQVQKDAPRFELYVNGVRHFGVPCGLSRARLPLCTQAIMGLAVELAHEAGANIVAECKPSAPLITHLHVTTGAEFVLYSQKGLRQLTAADVWAGISIRIFAGASDEYVCIRYVREGRQC